jgi:hypothetical protein
MYANGCNWFLIFQLAQRWVGSLCSNNALPLLGAVSKSTEQAYQIALNNERS